MLKKVVALPISDTIERKPTTYKDIFDFCKKEGTSLKSRKRLKDDIEMYILDSFGKVIKEGDIVCVGLGLVYGKVYQINARRGTLIVKLEDDEYIIKAELGQMRVIDMEKVNNLEDTSKEKGQDTSYDEVMEECLELL